MSPSFGVLNEEAARKKLLEHRSEWLSSGVPLDELSPAMVRAWHACIRAWPPAQRDVQQRTVCAPRGVAGSKALALPCPGHAQELGYIRNAEPLLLDMHKELVWALPSLAPGAPALALTVSLRLSKGI